VLGGYLPSMLPDRVEGLFDAIVIGEGDEVLAAKYSTISNRERCSLAIDRRARLTSTTCPCLVTI
jgi:hypothetical protein